MARDRRLSADVVAVDESPPGDSEAWQPVNAFALEHELRLAHASLPFFLTWLGAPVAPWAARIRRREARIAQVLGQGLFLVIGIYLEDENGYELVATEAASEAYFAAWFIVFVETSRATRPPSAPNAMLIPKWRWRCRTW